MQKRPVDVYQLGRHIVDLAAGEMPKDEPTRRQLSGIASVRRPTPQKRRECAKKAVAARWG